MSSGLIIRGDNTPYLQDYEYDSDPSRGYIYRATFRGTSFTKMNALAAAYIAEGIACKVRLNQGGVSSLSAEDSTQAQTRDNWEIVSNMERYQLLEHPTILAMDLEQHDQRILRNAFDNATQDWAGIASQLFETDAGNLANLEKFYKLQLQGSTAFEYEQYVLRHSTNVSNTWPGDPQMALMLQNIGAVYTIGTLLSEIGSGLWFLPCPARIQGNISGIVPPTAVAGTQWGAKKGSTNQTGEANNRLRISSEYAISLWSTVDYPNVV